MKRTIALCALVLVITAAVAVVTVQAPARDRRDYTTIHNFTVEIDGVVVGGFREVSGLHAETEILEYKDANNETRRLPGRTVYGPIVLKYGAGQNRMLWDWYQSTVRGQPVPKDGAVILLDDQSREIVRYNFYSAFPVKWTGPTLDASSAKGLAIETLELVVERIDVK